MTVIQTPRLIIDPVTEADAKMMIAVLNEPDFIRFVGDRCVNTVAKARAYIVDRIQASYHHNGLGMWAVRARDTGQALGICGLVKRDWLPEIDIGFGFPRQHYGKGYGSESAFAVLNFAFQELGLARILAVTHPQNRASRQLLARLGLTFQKNIAVPDSDKPACLYAIQAEGLHAN